MRVRIQERASGGSEAYDSVEAVTALGTQAVPPIEMVDCEVSSTLSAVPKEPFSTMFQSEPASRADVTVAAVMTGVMARS